MRADTVDGVFTTTSIDSSTNAANNNSSVTVYYSTVYSLCSGFATEFTRFQNTQRTETYILTNIEESQSIINIFTNFKEEDIVFELRI